MTVASTVWRKASFGLLVAAELAAAAAVTAVATSVPASAQFFFDERYPFLDPRSRRRGGYFDPYATNDRPPDFSRAPAANAAKARRAAGQHQDSRARRFDGRLAGLWSRRGARRDAGNRHHPQAQGLLRPDPLRVKRSDAPEWAQIARELIAAEKPQAMIMMIGVQDRQAIREKASRSRSQGRRAEAGRAETRRQGRRTEAPITTPPKPERRKPTRRRPAAKPQDDDESSRLSRPPEPQRGARTTGGLHEYHSREMGRALRQAHRRDDRSAQIRPTCRCSGSACRRSAAQKSTADALYLNEFYRARVGSRRHSLCRCLGRLCRRAGALLDTAVPDFEGQMRQSCAPMTACISPNSARASSRIMSSANCAACCARRRSR